jgi:hypothetical protein
MFGLAVVVFFSATGLTLNHPTWFPGAAIRHVQDEGTMDRAWLAGAGARGLEPERVDSSSLVARLEVVEYLRKTHGIRGALTDFRTDEQECVVIFKGPGYSADAFIDRESGRYHVSQSIHGLLAVVNDLHKGRDTGPVWSVLVDLSAILLLFISLTGLILLLYLRLRRAPGLTIALIGLALVCVVVVFGLP